MSIAKNNTYFQENGKIYYYKNGVSAEVPASAFGNLAEIKLDTSAFESVSGTFYTKAELDGKWEEYIPPIDPVQNVTFTAVDVDDNTLSFAPSNEPATLDHYEVNVYED